jgi:hypothetical protein
MRRVLLVGGALLAGLLGLLKFAGGSGGDDLARTAVRGLGSDAAQGTFTPRAQPRLPGGALPEVPPAGTDDSFRSTGSRLETELLETADAWGRNACDVAEFIESLQSPPTVGAMAAEHAPSAWKAVISARELYDASVALVVDGPTLAELREAYCAM